MNEYTIFQNILDNARYTSSDFVFITKYTLNNEDEKNAFISLDTSITQENAKIIYFLFIFIIYNYIFITLHFIIVNIILVKAYLFFLKMNQYIIH